MTFKHSSTKKSLHNSDFKFSLQNIGLSKQLKSADKGMSPLTRVAPVGGDTTGWQTDLAAKFKNFETHYEHEKTLLMDKLGTAGSPADVHRLVDGFFKVLDDERLSIKQSQGYAILKSQQALATDTSYATKSGGLRDCVLRESPTKHVA